MTVFARLEMQVVPALAAEQGASKRLAKRFPWRGEPGERPNGETNRRTAQATGRKKCSRLGATNVPQNYATPRDDTGRARAADGDLGGRDRKGFQTGRASNL